MIGAASVIIDDRGAVLLVRHGYGELNWELPGGAGIPGESAEATARREALEEVGVRLEVGELTGVYWDPAAGMHHFVFRARTIDDPHVADAAEIAEVGWFRTDDLPRPISDFTVKRITDALTRERASLAVVGRRVWLR